MERPVHDSRADLQAVAQMGGSASVALPVKAATVDHHRADAQPQAAKENWSILRVSSTSLPFTIGVARLWLGSQAQTGQASLRHQGIGAHERAGFRSSQGGADWLQFRALRACL